MKKSLLTSSILLLVTVSCNKLEQESNYIVETQVIKATIGQAETRVNINEDNSLTWTNGDSFAAFDKSDTSKKYVFTTKDSGSEAIFESNSSSPVLLDYAIYPYSDQYPQTITRDVLTMHLPSSYSYSKESRPSIPMYGHINNGKVLFHHLAGVIKIQLDDCPEWARSIKITASSPISGSFIADLTEDGPFLVSSSKNENDMSITVDLEISNNVVLYIPLPVQTYDSINVSLLGAEKKIELKKWTNKKVDIANIYSAEITYPVSEDDINSALEDAYASFTENDLFGTLSLDNYLFADIAGADANKGSTYADQPDLRDFEIYSLNPTNPYLLEKWKMIYKGVEKAHKVIALVDSHRDAIDNPNEIIGEAKFIKAVWLFEGTRIFGAAIPYVSLQDYQEGNNYANLSNYKNGDYTYIWDRIEDDLKDAIEKLPSFVSNDKLNSWAAKAMLAKLYLYWSSPYNGKNGTSDHWREASLLLEDIINNGTSSRGMKYQLATYNHFLFNCTNYSNFAREETIFSISINTKSATIPPGGIGTVALGWGFYQPTHEFVNSFMVDSNGLPLADYTSKAPLTTMGATAPITDLDIPVDPRLDYCAGRFGVPYLDYGIPTELNGWVRDYTNGGLYINKKNQISYGNLYTAYTDVQRLYHVIRFADILLMKAEIAIEQGNLATALDLINQVRARAANSFVKNEAAGKIMYDEVNGVSVEGAAANYKIGLYKSFSSAEEAHIALERERRAEFGMEGHRWFDLARWGKVGKELNAFREYENKFIPNKKYVNTYNDNWVTFPIPQSVIDDSNGNIIQNENWK